MPSASNVMPLRAISGVAAAYLLQAPGASRRQIPATSAAGLPTATYIRSPASAASPAVTASPLAGTTFSIPLDEHQTSPVIRSVTPMVPSPRTTTFSAASPRP